MNKNFIDVKICYAEPECEIKRSTLSSAGYDLKAYFPDKETEQVVVPAKGSAIIKTGVKILLPPGFQAEVRSRSGLAFKNNVFVLNAPGTIDEDYYLDIGVKLFNLGTDDLVVKRGDRIAQLVFMPVYFASFENNKEDVLDVENFEKQVEERKFKTSESGGVVRTGGFGSTGINDQDLQNKQEEQPIKKQKTN